MPTSVKGLMLSLFSFLWLQLSWSQNLVPNPGFETFTSCPSTSCQWFLVSDWDNINGFQGCNNGNSGSPDYFNTCGTGFFGTPNTLNGEVSPFAGNGIMGLSTWLGFSNNFREYLQVELNSPLVIGNTYALTFSFTNGDFDPILGYGGYGTEFGVHFSVGSLTQQNGTDPIILTPTYETSGAVFDIAWQTVSFTFVATDNATHLSIGNFRNDANSTIQQFATSSSASGYAYYYFDEISVIEQNPLSVNLLSLEGIARPGEGILTWTVAEYQEKARFLIERSGNARVFYTLGEIQSSTGEQKTYTFRDSTIQQQQYYYRIRYESEDGSSEISRILQLAWERAPEFEWYYDEGKRKLTLLHSPNTKLNTLIRIYDMSGKVVFYSQIVSGSFLVPTRLGSGLYLLELVQKGQSSRQKLWLR
ncbi:MAG: T9SS type A sorting domain-containing protein [Bacteroidota bacterium]